MEMELSTEPPTTDLFSSHFITALHLFLRAQFMTRPEVLCCVIHRHHTRNDDLISF